MSEGRLSKITQTIEKMEKDKKNYARRMNYKINKLRDILYQVARFNDGKCDEPKAIKEESWISGAEESVGSKELKDTVKAIATRDEKILDIISEEPPIDYSATFEIERDQDVSYEIWADNKWSYCDFILIQNGDAIRLLDGDGAVIKKDGVGFFRANSGVFRNEFGKHAIKAGYGHVPSNSK